MSQRQAITLEWLKRVRPYALGNQDVGSEAWDAFRGGQELGEDSFDSFAQWLVQYWDWYVGLLAQRGVQIPESEKVQPVLQAEKPVETSRPYGRSVPVNIEGVTVSAVKNRTGTPALGHRGAQSTSQVNSVLQATADKQKKVASSGTEVEFDLAPEIFETEWGQWVLLVFFFILTLVDWVTNVWMLTGRTDLGSAVDSASFWHWLIGGILVFSEMYVTMARALIKRTSKARGTQITYLYAMLVIAIIAAVYDFAATVIPLYRFIAASGDLAGILGGLVVGLLIAIVTTVGSSKVIEQAKICFDLFRQRK